MMERHEIEEGFTVLELVVTLFVMGLVLTVLFQIFYTTQSQQLAATRRSAANDIAVTNLRKITSIANFQNAANACDTDPLNNENNPILLLADPNMNGSTIATNETSGVTTPTWSTANLTPESLSGTSLPTGTNQILRVVYPEGCGAMMPAQIISIVKYNGLNTTSLIKRTTYVNQ